MKNNAYKLTIAILVICLGVVAYLLNSEESTNTSSTAQTQISKISSDANNNAVDIKDLKNTKKGDVTKYTPEKIDNTQANEKLSELQDQLDKTEKLLMEYNKSKPNALLKNQEISEILSLEQKRIEKSNTENTDIQTKNAELLKLQAQIKNVRKTLEDISK